MSKARKLAQAARREARMAMSAYRSALIDKLSIFNSVLKPKPKWIPSVTWRWISGRIIDVEKLQKFLNPKG